MKVKEMSLFPERPFDFERDDPPRLLLAGEPEDLFRAVKAAPHWTARSLQIADATLAHWASEAHARRNDRQGMAAIHRLIGRLQAIRPAPEKADDLDIAGYYRRWDGMAALLETRAATQGRHDPAATAGRTHMPELKQQLDAGPAEGVPTQDLLRALGLSKVRMSQLLKLAEAAGLVECRRVGGKQWVAAVGIWRREGADAGVVRAATASNVAALPRHSTVRHIGLDILARRKAA